MSSNEMNRLTCEEFENGLSDYLDSSLGDADRKMFAAHALSCPVCHDLMNEVKRAVEACRDISVPEVSMTRLEARILAMTAPETAIECDEFENFLTDYLDGFLPAPTFHRWERHAVLCERCTDLPGAVVRSIAACYSYKAEELEVPEGLNERILEATIGTSKADDVRAPLGARAKEWLRGLSFPKAIPQLAPVALIVLLAFLTFNQSVSADGSAGGVYQKSVELAGKTYQQSAQVMLGNNESE